MPPAGCPPARQTNHKEGLGPSSQRPPSQKYNLQSPKQACFLATIFLVPKSAGGNRVIINLSKLNKYILAPRSHMTNHLSLASLLQAPVWLASLDIQDVYFHVPIRKTLRKILAFLYEGNLYTLRALPFSLTVTPYISTRLLRYPSSLLHPQGVLVAAYLEDWTAQGRTSDRVSRAYTHTMNCVSN